MSASQVRIRAGAARAGASTGRGELGECHSVATDTPTQAEAPTLSAGAAGVEVVVLEVEVAEAAGADVAGAERVGPTPAVEETGLEADECPPEFGPLAGPEALDGPLALPVVTAAPSDAAPVAGPWEGADNVLDPPGPPPAAVPAGVEHPAASSAAQTSGAVAQRSRRRRTGQEAGAPVTRQR